MGLVAKASERHLDLDDQVLALAEPQLADLDVDVGTGSRNNGAWRARDFANAEEASLGDLDVQADVGGCDREDAADNAGQRVSQVVCEAGHQRTYPYGAAKT